MKIRFIIIGVLLSCILMAAPVDLNRAQRVAGNIYAEGMDVAAKRGDLMPLKDMEQRKLLLEATMVSVPDVARRKEPKI